jgi:hypothetical protein
VRTIRETAAIPTRLTYSVPSQSLPRCQAAIRVRGRVWTNGLSDCKVKCRSSPAACSLTESSAVSRLTVSNCSHFAFSPQRSVKAFDCRNPMCSFGHNCGENANGFDVQAKLSPASPASASCRSVDGPLQANDSQVRISLRPPPFAPAIPDCLSISIEHA